MTRLLFIFCCLSSPAFGASLCGVIDRDEMLTRLAGTWTGQERVSVEGETLSRVRRLDGAGAAVTAGGSYLDHFIDGLGLDRLPLMLDPRYDVDRVDDLLDTTDSADLADVLSDIPCGPEALPQLAATLDIPGETSVQGTITLIAYFDDRLLRLTEMTISRADAVVFMTGATLLQPVK